MKKILMASVLLLFGVSAVSVKAESNIQEIWKYTTTDLNADWDKNSPDWNNNSAVKSESCARFATAYDGKIYTINMKTMSIAEITGAGWRDLYRLPEPEVAGDYYGTAISSDRHGNFLIGHYFTKSPQSSTVWSVYNPATGKIETFEIPVSEDYSSTVDDKSYSGVGRIDCVGRVLGDLTEEAVFFIGSSFGETAPFVRIVKISHSDDGSLIVNTGHSPAIGHNIASTSLAIVQPKDADYGEFLKRAFPYSGFYMYDNAGAGVNDFVTYDDDGVFDTALAENSALKSVANAYTSGFDTFVLKGIRYFIVNNLRSANPTNTNTMDIAVVREDGEVIGRWENPDYASQYGYSSIIAEPLDDGTANIYVYNSTNADGGNGRKACSSAAMLNFNPERSGVIAPDDPIGSTVDNPLVVSSAQDLVDLADKLIDGENFIVLDDDIDMSGVAWKILCKYGSKAVVHLDGRCHVIKNLRPAKTEQDGSLLGYFTGSVKNLGLEDVYIYNTWYCVGAIAGYANNATIDNCYVTGMICGAASGAFVGCNNGPLTITNSYSYADTSDKTGSNEYSGGLVGRCDAQLSVNNCYAACSVTSAAGHASGIVSIRRSTDVRLTDVIAWNIAVEGPETHQICVGGDAAMDNVMVWDGMEINGTPVEGGVSDKTLRDEIARWEAFNEGKTDIVHDYPVLNWQNVFVTTEIDDIIADGYSTDETAIYYNLQGVRIDNPSAGLYIVRRGKTVTKEYVR
ncbi:MAG: hypothetical protein K2J12_01175 [Muribaculaceae bacterium]|nr:hypothetical protein [Muribaculaceae bacterium]